MKVVIDTSSLMALVRYYMPFDKDDRLKNLIKGKVERKEIIVLDKVQEESKYVTQGLIIKTLNFLKSEENIVKTTDLLPYPKFFNIVDEQLCNKKIKILRNLSIPEYEQQKRNYLITADGKLILYCLIDKNQNTLLNDKPMLVSEETGTDNDNKLFKKLPECCRILKIEHCSLPTLIEKHFKLKLSEYFR
ncbi:MAG: DUF4411 family protein [Bacteroidales bacterium]|nr:DUF4411 family protein [Bacteroidales bacterium]